MEERCDKGWAYNNYCRGLAVQDTAPGIRGGKAAFALISLPLILLSNAAPHS